MRSLLPVIFAAAVVLFLAPAEIRAQDYAYGDSYLYVDRLGDLEGYSVTYNNYGAWYIAVSVDATLYDPNNGHIASGSDNEYWTGDDATVYLQGQAYSTGNYYVTGHHYYSGDGWGPYDTDPPYSYYYAYWSPPVFTVTGSSIDEPTTWPAGSDNPITITGANLVDLYPFVWSSCPAYFSFNVWSTTYSQITASLYISSGLPSECTVTFDLGPWEGQVHLKPLVFTVEYRSYIPVDHVTGPTPCLYHLVPFFLIYKGDPTGGTFRTSQSLTIVPDAQFQFGAYQDTGYTNNYGFASPLNGSTLSNLDEDGVCNDCYLWNARGKATPGWTVESNYPSSHHGTAHLSGSATNPLDLALGGISWNTYTSINTSNPNDPTATVSFDHTCYPAHQVAVNGKVVYSYNPPSNDTGYILDCLTNPYSHVVNTSEPISVPNQ